MKIAKISIIAFSLLLLAMVLSSCGFSDIKLLEKGKGTWSDWGGSGEYDVTVYSYYVDNPDLLRNRIELNMEVDKILESKKNENAVIVVFNQKTPLQYMKNNCYFQLRTGVSIADTGYTKSCESVGTIKTHDVHESNSGCNKGRTCLGQLVSLETTRVKSKTRLL